MTKPARGAGLWVSPLARKRPNIFRDIVRHSLVCVASGRYESPVYGALDVETETKVLRDWLTADRPGLPRMVDLSPPVDPRLSQVDLTVRDEDGKARFRAGDAVFVYVTGHGFSGEGGHRLALSRTVPGVTGSAYRTVELLSALKDGGVEHAVVVVDTCESGRAVTDLGGYTDLPPGWLVLFTSGKDAQAGVGVLTSALETFLAEQVRAASGPLGLAAEPYLQPRELFLALNDALYAAGQRLHHAGQFPIGTAVHPCLPNPGYDPNRDPGHVGGQTEGDRADGVLSRAVSTSDLDAHWAPRALGFAPGTANDLFTDRPALMRALVDRVRSGSGLVVLTGRAGCGKSSALSRLVALSDAEFRAAHPDLWSGLPEDVLPRQGEIDLAVLAKGHSVAEVLTRLGEGLGAARVDIEGVAEALREFAARTGRRATVVVDAVDESRDARGLGVALAELGEQQPPVRLLVGVRGQRARAGGLVGVPAVLTGGWGDAEVLGADEPPLWIDGDLADYARRLLLTSPSTPFVDDERTAAVAAELARLAERSFLLVQFAARNLAAQTAPLASHEPDLAGMFADGLVGLLREDLERALPDLEERESAEDLLIGCAFALGAGTPWRAVWARLAGAVSADRRPARTYGDRDVAELLSGRLAGYLVQDHADGEAVFRPFHDELATALRALHDPVEDGASAFRSTSAVDAAVHRRIVTTLRPFTDELQPSSSLDDVPPYVRRHLTDHALRARTPAQLLADSPVLAAIEPSAAGRLAEEGSLDPRLRAVLEHIADVPASISLGRRAAEVELWTKMESAPPVTEGLRALASGEPWRAAWADLSSTPANRVLARTRPGRVNVLLTWSDPLDGAAVCLVESASGVRLVEVATAKVLAECAIDGPSSAAVNPAGDIVAVGMQDGQLLILDGRTLGVIDQWAAHAASVSALSFATDEDGRPGVLSAGQRVPFSAVRDVQGLLGEVAYWDLVNEASRLRWRKPVFGTGVYGLVVVGRTVAVAGDCYRERGGQWDLLRLLRLHDGELIAAVPHDSRGVDTAVALPSLDGWVLIRRQGQGLFLVDTARPVTARVALRVEVPLDAALAVVPASADSGGPWVVIGDDRGLSSSGCARLTVSRRSTRWCGSCPCPACSGAPRHFSTDARSSSRHLETEPFAVTSCRSYSAWPMPQCQPMTSRWTSQSDAGSASSLEALSQDLLHSWAGTTGSSTGTFSTVKCWPEALPGSSPRRSHPSMTRPCEP